MRQTTSKSRKPRRRTPWITLGATHLYFIEHPVQSVRKEQAESVIGANANSRTRNCPESGRLTDSIEKIGMKNYEIYPIPDIVTPSMVPKTDAASTPRELLVVDHPLPLMAEAPSISC
jgi:hypothetical protein